MNSATVTSKITLRAATVADAAAVTYVFLSSRAHFLPFVASLQSPDEVCARVRERLPAARMTLAVAEEQVVGVLALSQQDGYGWIEQLYLLPEVVGRGIGSMLLDVALASLPRPLRLYTFQQNLGAQRFFEAHGFMAIEFGDGSGNEEGCPDVLYELV